MRRGTRNRLKFLIVISSLAANPSRINCSKAAPQAHRTTGHAILNSPAAALVQIPAYTIPFHLMLALTEPRHPRSGPSHADLPLKVQSGVFSPRLDFPFHSLRLCTCFCRFLSATLPTRLSLPGHITPCSCTLVCGLAKLKYCIRLVTASPWTSVEL